MKMLNNLTISQRLLIPSGIVVVGFMLILFVYQYDVSLREQFIQKQQQWTDFHNTINDLEIVELRGEVSLQRFLLRKHMEDIGPFRQAMKAANEHINMLDRELPDSALLTYVHNIKQSLSDYESTSSQMIEDSIKLGLNENKGLLGDLRQAIHEVEKILLDLNEMKLAYSMLMMRRHEKDFLARLDDTYIEQMAEEKQHFSHLLQNAAISASEKTMLQQRVDHYYQVFMNLVKVKQEERNYISSVGKDAENLENTLQLLEDRAHEALITAQTKRARVASRMNQIFFTALTVIGLMLVVLLFLFSRNFKESLAQLIERMHELADGSGDLSRRLEIHGRDETAILAKLVNRLMENLAELIGKVQQSGIQVASSVTEIAASAKEQEATATEHAATTNQVAASVREITATSRHLGKTTEEVAQLAQGTADSAADGQKMLSSLDETMNRVAQVSGSITDKLAVLNEKASHIGDMVTTINKVADQTNLLSLNAAIEAEKAGEYGRGFAVVATEIRRLADQTAVATYDIEQMVGEVQSAVSAGVMSMDKFSEEIQSSVDEARQVGAQLENVIEQVQALAPHIEAVNEGLQAQIVGASQIDEAMMSLSEAAQQTAEFARQSNSAIAELNEAARILREGASLFKVRAS